MTMPTSFAGVALNMAPGTASGYKGVTKHGAGWEARTGGRKRRCLGTYMNPTEAAYVLAMDEERKDKFKEDADPQGIKLSLDAAFTEGDSCPSHHFPMPLPS
jgi:hypothetical protein